MGVPVVACPGETFAGRHALTYLRNVGLEELATADAAGYVERAAALAGNWPRLAELRAGLRQHMAASPLCDAQRFAANFLRLVTANRRLFAVRDMIRGLRVLVARRIGLPASAGQHFLLDTALCACWAITAKFPLWKFGALPASVDRRSNASCDKA